MIKYRLKKNLPCAKAGEIFREDFDKNDNNNVYLYQESYGIKQHKICLEDIDNFDEWFEEVEKPKTFEVPDEYYIPIIYADKIGITTSKISNDTVVHQPLYLNSSSVGLAFETEEEAEKYIKYLKVKAIIKEDTKGFKPDWKNSNEAKYYGVWNFDREKTEYFAWDMYKSSDIFFKSIADIEESFKKHPEEWRVYLTYEQ